jgi:hypothetical protein
VTMPERTEQSPTRVLDKRRLREAVARFVPIAMQTLPFDDPDRLDKIRTLLRFVAGHDGQALPDDRPVVEEVPIRESLSPRRLR